MKKNIIFIIALVLIVISSGCEDLNNPGEVKTKNSILYQLRVNAPRQQLFIYRIAGMAERRDFSARDMYYDFFNRNAEISLKDLQSGQSTGFMLTQDTLPGYSGYTSSSYANPCQPYYTDNGPLSPEPSTDYVLSVNAGGDIITGKVTTPGDFEITAPKKSEVIRGMYDLYHYTVRWNKSPNAMGYFVRFYCPFKFRDDPVENHYPAGYRDVMADTSCALENIIFIFGDYILSGECTIQIEAYDNNYVQHYRNMKESVGLNGAYGCFSSSLIKEVKFRFLSH